MNNYISHIFIFFALDNANDSEIIVVKKKTLTAILKNLTSEVPASKYLQPSKTYVTGFPQETVNSHFAVINSLGKKVVLRKSNGNTAFVIIAALWGCPVRIIIPAENPDRVTDHNNDNNKIPNMDNIPNLNVIPNRAPMQSNIIVKTKDDKISAIIGAITRAQRDAGEKYRRLKYPDCISAFSVCPAPAEEPIAKEIIVIGKRKDKYPLPAKASKLPTPPIPAL